MQFAAPTTVLITLALAACVPSIVVGDHPQDTGSPEGSSGGSTDATPTTSASSGESEPGVCGDGVVDAGERCDDGNDEANDGCDGACQRSGRVVWSIELAGIDAVADLDLDPAGRILVNGWGGDTAHLLAFAPDGTELWRRTIADPGELAIDVGGRIFIAGIAGTLQAFSSEMKSLWSLDIDGGFAGLALGPDAVYSAAHSGGDKVQVTVRRHDPATGEIVWVTATPPGQSVLCDDLAVIGEQVVSVGKLDPELAEGDALVVAFGPDGADPWAEQFPGAATQWSGAAPIGASELVIAGNSPDNKFVLRRLGPDNEQIWTSPRARGPRASQWVQESRSPSSAVTSPATTRASSVSTTPQAPCCGRRCSRSRKTWWTTAPSLPPSAPTPSSSPATSSPGRTKPTSTRPGSAGSRSIDGTEWHGRTLPGRHSTKPRSLCCRAGAGARFHLQRDSRTRALGGFQWRETRPYTPTSPSPLSTA
ncbi:PQQ-binding-like beta-propeller repeat protein [Nannocystis pusilla]|uniref:PQQ-binding-like beta-propeller repeat protein n=1 Tax=Nannocystis pusilla TaxID=889268 RepID=A0ABS7TMV2_9BACT|nr:PQQ-binding-like beta-propeller repeat protein [Nannocystis pusilla]